MKRYEGLRTRDRSEDYCAGHRRAGRACVDWLHRRAKQMDDPKATALLNAMGFELGNYLAEKRNMDKFEPLDREDQQND